MRTLVFQPDSKHYEQLYWALIMSPLPPTKEDLPVLAAVLPKVRAIGQIKPAIDNQGNPRKHLTDEVKFYVTVAGGDVNLEEQEYQWAMKHADAAIAGVHKGAAEDYFTMLEYVKSVEKWDATPSPAASA